ncbi:helix-turn-helix domain-containing protein [Streptomyces sp. NPDC003077]|uniref:TetR/AcrR family transcriptional regulator n=1 Tax=Streptomyces sp. NPDC003077 TaxID=3154443 RepID=UPI0033BE4ABD
MHTQGSQWSTAVTTTHGSDNAGGNGSGGGHGTAAGTTHSANTVGAGNRNAPLRVDAQRNLEHVLRAAREVFGELGYGAPMEDVARRARVGVGTVYRRFPSKDVLVRRIAEEETSRLTDQARTALGQEDDPWSALSRFLRTSVASGAGRLLPPSILRVSAGTDGPPEGRVPQQRTGTDDLPGAFRVVAQRGAPGMESADGSEAQQSALTADRAAASGVSDQGRAARATVHADGGAQALLDVVGQLVERARTAGELRADVTVSDVLLVIATGAPALPDPAQQQAASARLLEILLEGLRSRPAL